jgi:predicted permease
MGGIGRGLWVAARQLRKAPVFALTVVLTLALGIGSTTAIFSLVEGVLLRPLAYHDAERLVRVGDHLGGSPNISVTAREIAIYSKAAQAFSSLGGYILTNYEISGGARPENVAAARVGADVFATLGVPPLAGRYFTPQEEAGHAPLAVISDALWLRRYDRAPRVLGSSIVLDRRAYTVIGVMPRGFSFPLQAGRMDQAQIWVPLSLTLEELAEPHAGFWGYHMVARLKDGVTSEQAVKDADRVAGEIMRGFPPSMSSLRIRGDAVGLREFEVAEVRPLLRTLFFAVAIVLLIACANASGLLLVRAIRRRREYAVRLALGAGSGAILREAVCEGLVLSVAGGAVGLAFAAATIGTAVRLLPESMPRIDAISMDANVAIFALAAALVTGAACSIAPAFAALRTSVIASLKEGGSGGRAGAASHSRLRSMLMVAEIAVALMLLTVSGAFLRSFQKTREVDPGFRPDHVLLASYQLPMEQYPTNAAVESFHRSVVERLSGKPGIVAAGVTNVLAGSGAGAFAAYTIEGTSVEGWKLKFSSFANVYGDYFRAMGIALLDGRTFTMNDRADAPLVAIVNDSMARHCWPGQTAIGKRFHAGNPQKGLPWMTVVGVVADTKTGARDKPSEDQWYSPALQPAILLGTEAASAGKLASPAGGYIAVRSALPPGNMAETLRATVAEYDPLLALQQVQPMSEVIANVEAPRRFNTDLITAFAIGALLLAITGIYTVVAFSVSLRTHEIAIRMALGSQRGGIARLVLAASAKTALLGCALGVAGSLAVSHVVSAFLFGVSATDPLVYGAAVVLMMGMALLASAVPALRAASADPVDTLRST